MWWLLTVPYIELESKGHAMTTSFDTKNETQVDVFVKDLETNHCVEKTVTFSWNSNSRFRDLVRAVRDWFLIFFPFSIRRYS